MQNFIIFFSSIRWQDIVDILLNTYIIFRLYVLFKGTNVFRVLIGIALLWFFQRIASSMGLVVTSWAIQGVTATAAIIIIVIFRNEIRSVLQTRNVRSLLWGFRTKSVETPTDAIVESIFQLAARSQGALLVFPGKEDVHESIHSGIPWEGLVSKEMITSIFWPDNPVHDGAAIIRGDRVIQVGSILPLSRRTDLPSNYGTRHRAAAGLAEMTDSLVIVVSEERGTIVAAKDSKMVSVDRKEKLAKLIKEHLGISSDHKRLFKREKTELALAALVSFIFISSIWLSFTRGTDTLITLESPVGYISRQPGLDIYDTSVSTVRLDISGSGPLVNSIKSEDVKVTVDLSQAHIGANNCPLSEKNISLPPGVFLKNIRPPFVQVTLDKSADKKVPIQVDWTGRLPSNKTISDVTITPPFVKVYGRSALLKDLSAIYTEKVSLSKITGSGEATVGVVLNNPSLRLDDNSGVVTIKYVIRQKDTGARR
jgi:diadenylate cyclase